MAQVNHGGGNRVEQPVKVEDGFHVGTRQYEHDDPHVCRRELVPNGPPRAGRRPAASAAPHDKAESETAREWRR